MKFHDLKYNLADFESEDDLIYHINTNLSENKENYLRLNLDGNVNQKKFNNALRSSYVEIKVNKEEPLYNLVNLYPNSLLKKYYEKFSKNLTENEKRALEIGLDAIYRSKDD